MPGAPWDDNGSPPPPPEDLTLRLHNAAAAPTDDAGVFQLVLQTSRGDISGLLHPVEGGSGAAIFVGGAMGGIDGPADGIYADLPRLLGPGGVSCLRLQYRLPNDLEECVLDVLAGCSFFKGVGAAGAVLVGHSFGAAVVIKAGQLAPLVRGVVSLSPQLHGTREVEDLGRPLLLVHGTADRVLAHRASEDIYARARDPKQLVLYQGAGHRLLQAREPLRELLAAWITARLAGARAVSGRSEVVLPEPPAPPT